MCCKLGRSGKTTEGLAWGTKQKTVQALSLREAGILFCGAIVFLFSCSLLVSGSFAPVPAA